MAEDVTITNSYMTYIYNHPYIYPSDNHNTVSATWEALTGWHVIPSFMWRHFCTPKDWFYTQLNYEAYSVKGIEVTLFNMVPMATQLAIQGTNTFTAFNNCIYAWGYTDDLYETPWHNWMKADMANNQHNLLYKEGWVGQFNASGGKRYSWPEYKWRQPNVFNSTFNTWAMHDDDGDSTWPHEHTWPSGVVWDPLNRPESLMELRPGKNAISFNWKPHACDEGKWFNIDGIASWSPWGPTGPYNGMQRPNTWKRTEADDPNEISTKWQETAGVGDYTLPNLAFQPLVPTAWWWKEMQQSIIQPDRGADGAKGLWTKTDYRYPGTEWEQFKYPPMQFFTKMIPIWNESGTLVECSANISVRTKLHLACKKRRSAIYAPTAGPFPWRSVYSAKTLDLNFYPSMVRVRTGGGRRTWQNIEVLPQSGSSNTSGHWRELPYTYNVSYSDNIAPSGSGQGGTYTNAKNHDLKVTFSKDMDRVVIHHGRQDDPMEGRPARPDPPQKPRRRALSPGLNIHIHDTPGNVTHPHT